MGSQAEWLQRFSSPSGASSSAGRTVFASAVGPLRLAEALRQTGSYDLVFNGLAVVVVFLGIASAQVLAPAEVSKAAVRT